ncbi:DUF2156 domain-containing protein [Fibrobacter succinogenes]|uniref:Phosphatidylglycerol lysyltransferase C-terminal domain-containing protein n=1 Tax=Fibrobacter succinogenes TaxID=833 RepID=A0A380RVW5_FIBSU|nr:phosphatidylglycerol lysyltransferase domain-containing protein [Fibrobacter succinogenes]PWJ37204.1 hypothetical protein IE02_0683 [Fibrobacter succinogenes subsp. elongatus]SUQ19451.1 hypothetical protein SAMN05661053_0683 [Fibrobacter succinogenes]
MLEFRIPELSDRENAARAVAESGYIGSDAAFASLFLWRKKYGTLMALQNGFLFRYYQGEGSRRGYAFPLGAEDPREALDAIVQDAKESGRPLEFCLVDETRAHILWDYFKKSIQFVNDRGDSDYIYSAESLATLAGNTYRKKRNHISKFNRSYEHYELREITVDNFVDALEVEKKWLQNSMSGEEPCEPTCECEEAAWAERSTDEKSRMAELCAIEEALKNFDALGLKGAILYVNNAPVGMTIASEIVPRVWDIHFEKVIGEYADNGGYAVINKMFAETLASAKLINREEDINIEGLRKAKLSYYPLIILDKCHALQSAF